MKKTTTQQAIEDAERFIKAARALERENIIMERDNPALKRFLHYPLELAKYTAATKRASMDLTRTLAAMRQSR